MVLPSRVPQGASVPLPCNPARAGAPTIGGAARSAVPARSRQPLLSGQAMGSAVRKAGGGGGGGVGVPVVARGVCVLSSAVFPLQASANLSGAAHAVAGRERPPPKPPDVVRSFPTNPDEFPLRATALPLWRRPDAGSAFVPLPPEIPPEPPPFDPALDAHLLPALSHPPLQASPSLRPALLSLKVEPLGVSCLAVADGVSDTVKAVVANPELPEFFRCVVAALARPSVAQHPLVSASRFRLPHGYDMPRARGCYPLGPEVRPERRLHVPTLRAITRGQHNAAFVVNAALFGFPTGTRRPAGMTRTVVQRNHGSCRKLRAGVLNVIRTELKEGKLLGPFHAPPFQPALIPPVAAVFKPSAPHKPRVILDLSCAPPGMQSANDTVDLEREPKLKYSTVHHLADCVAAIYACAPPGTEVAVGTSDVSGAYRGCPVNVQDSAWCQTFAIPGGGEGFDGFGPEDLAFFVDLAMAQGGRGSPLGFSALSSAIAEFVCECGGVIPASLLDDFSCLGEGVIKCHRTALLLHATMLAVGLQPSWGKEQCASLDSCVFLGVLLRVPRARQCMGFASQRWAKMSQTITAMRHRGWRATFDALQSLCGVLVWVTIVLTHLRPFLRPILNQLHREWRGLRRLRRDVQTNLLLFLRVGKLTPTAKFRNAPRDVELTFESDASSSIGYGFVCHELQLYVAELWTPSYMEAGVHINVSETLAAAACLRIAGTLCPSARVHLRLDSTTAIAVVNKLTSRNSDLVHLARGIAHTCVRFDLAAHASHIPGCENVIADAASRGMPVPVPPSYSQYRVAEPDLMNWFSLHKRWQAKRLLQEAARQENATWPTGRGSRRTMDCQ